jgi:hypothetical protein
VLIGVGPDADWRAKLLIYQVMEGAILEAYLQLSQVVARSSKRRDTHASKLVRRRCRGG